MVQIELPHVNVLSKIDIIEQFGKLGIHTIIILFSVFIDVFKDVRCKTRIHIKSFKRSLVIKNIYLDDLSTASLQSSTGKLIYLLKTEAWQPEACPNKYF